MATAARRPTGLLASCRNDFSACTIFDFWSGVSRFRYSLKARLRPKFRFGFWYVL